MKTLLHRTLSSATWGIPGSSRGLVAMATSAVLGLGRRKCVNAKERRWSDANADVIQRKLKIFVRN